MIRGKIGEEGLKEFGILRDLVLPPFGHLFLQFFLTKVGDHP